MRREINETRDRCGPAVAAVYRVPRDEELCLCGHCANGQWEALIAHGWAIRLAGGPSETPHAA